MNEATSLRGRVWGAGVLALGLLGVADAQDGEPPTSGERPTTFALDLNTGLTYSDNVTRVAESGDAIEDTVGSAGFVLEHDYEGRRLRSSAAADLAWLHYFDDSFDSEVVGFLTGDLRADLLPERFEWVVEETFGQVRSNPLAADTADNREYVNYLSTGPDFALRLGASNFARMSVRYSDNTYEELSFDNRRYGGTLSLGRQMAETSELSLNVSSERVDYDTAENIDFDRNAAYLQFAGQGRRTGLSLQVGYMEIEDDLGASGGALVNLSLSRRISPSATLSLSGGTRISDAGDIFREAVDQRARFADRVDGSEVTVPTDDTFEDRTAGVSYEFRRNRTALRLGGAWVEERYNRDSTLDRTMTTWSGDISREISRVLRVWLEVSFSEQEYEALGFEDEELFGRIGAVWSLGRRAALRFAYDYFHRDSSEVSSGIEENRAGVTFTYSLSAVE